MKALIVALGIGISIFCLQLFVGSSIRLLPDHPLYRAQVLRDRVVLRFIKDSVKRLEYHLLLADEGMRAAVALYEKGNVSLAKETALKAEHHYTELVTEYKWAYWFAKPIPRDLDRRIFDASSKHQEMLSLDKEVFFQVINFSQTNGAELKALKSP